MIFLKPEVINGLAKIVVVIIIRVYIIHCFNIYNNNILLSKILISKNKKNKNSVAHDTLQSCTQPLLYGHFRISII